MIQPEFRLLVLDALTQCKEYLGYDFLAAYLHGSIDKGDAVPGVSDLDLFLVSRRAPTEADKAWLKALCEMLCGLYDVIDEAHITLTGEENLRSDRFSCFALKYNATLLDGEAIAGRLSKDDPESYLPDLRLAKMRLGFARQCLNDALSGKRPACTGPLPENTYYAARKYARYFIIIEGAYYLMGRGKFISFESNDVLGGLIEETTEHREAIELTRSVLCDPLGTGVGHEAYILKVAPLIEWMFDQIEEAQA